MKFHCHHCDEQQHHRFQSNPLSLFVTADEQISVDNGNLYCRVNRWTSSVTQPPSPRSVGSQCSGLFIDSNDELDCSQQIVWDRLRLHCTILGESLSRRTSICLSLSPEIITFNCFVKEKSMEQQHRQFDDRSSIQVNYFETKRITKYFLCCSLLIYVDHLDFKFFEFFFSPSISSR